MRVLLGLAGLAAVNAQTVQILGSSASSSKATYPPVGQSAFTSIVARHTSASGALATVTPPLGSGFLNSANWVIYTPNAITAISFELQTNQYTGQMQYRWAPNYPDPNVLYPNRSFSSQTYTCDPCAGGTAITCNSATGPGATPSPTDGYFCANLARNYVFTELKQSTISQDIVNSFAFQLFDVNTNPAPNVSSYSFQIVRRKPDVIVGDPQIVGMQGQDFQVHGMPDEIFNMVSSPELQINARFTYLESAACHDNYTACFAHPGTYITEEGIRMGKDKVRITAGSFKKGLTVHVNGKKVKSNVELKHGSIEIVNHRRTVVNTETMKVTITNSDKFMNQEMTLLKEELLNLGGSSRKVLKDNERFHPEVPLHGLQGQTWRNVEYPSGLDYEGSIMDYHVVSGNIYGSDFLFNQFKQ